MNQTRLRKIALAIGLSSVMAITASAQFTGGKLAVLRAGDNGTNQNQSNSPSDINDAHQAPAFIDEFDPAIPVMISSTNTGTNGPMYSVAIPTNDPAVPPPFEALWFNGHASTEGYLTLSADAGTLAFAGYGGNILAIAGTPSKIPVPRGICVVDVSGNTYIPLETASNDVPGWYSFGTNSQINPRGVVSDDGTNNFFGSGGPGGNEWYQLGNGSTPVSISDFSSTRSIEVINGTCFTSLQEADGGSLYPAGIYDFQPFNGSFGTPGGLPEGDDYFLNLVIPASPLYPNVDAFDINPQQNMAYVADDNYGIQKYIEVGGNWTLACAFGITNNTSTNLSLGFPKAYTGCFGLVVDWTGSYPVVFATTTEGNSGSNRVIRLDDNYNFTDGQLHTNVPVTTLVTSWSENVVFRGLAWTPDRRPSITANPASQSVVTGSTASFSVAASALFPNTCYWLTNGVVDPNQTTSSYSVPSAMADGTYQVIVSNSYGAVTSAVANLTVTPSAVAPSIVSPIPALNLTNALYDVVTIPVTVSGTTPLSYQWWLDTGSATSQLSDAGDFTGSATATLTIHVSATNADAGSYYLVAGNGTGTPVSNLVATVSFVTPQPIIVANPTSLTVPTNGVASFNVITYPPVGLSGMTYQWYNGSMPVSGSQWSGTQSATLTDSDVTESDTGTNYYVVATDAGGSVTSAVVSLNVAPSPSFSALGFTSPNMIYQQNFDSLPDPGTTEINIKGSSADTIDGITYSLSDPFDFAAPLNVNNTGFGGMALSNSMVGWWASDLGGASSVKIQAQTGGQTTGLIVSFGCTNAQAQDPNGIYTTNNRALGILTSSSTSFDGNAGDAAYGTFALRIRNLTGQTLSNFDLSYVSELWRNSFSGTAPQILTNFYYVDQLGTNTSPTNGTVSGWLTNLTFSTSLGIPHGFTTASSSTAPISTTNMSFTNVTLTTNWTPGGILWIVWEAPIALSGGQGFGIDNVVFTAGAQPSLQIAQTNTSTVISWPQMFTGYSLQYNTNLANPNGWQPVPATVTPYQGMNLVTNPLPNTAAFFRLEN